MSRVVHGRGEVGRVVLLSVSFMLLFTAFQTMGNIEKVVLDSIKRDNTTEGGGFSGDGYTSLSIIYGVFSLSNWLAPSVIALCSTKWSMVFGGVVYTAFIASFLYPLTWLLYVMSAVLGFGAAVTWTAQGSYLTKCSSEATMSRNAGIFWAIFQCSMFFGNCFVFWQFQGKEEIDKHTLNVVFLVLTIVSALGVLSLGMLRAPSAATVVQESDDDEPRRNGSEEHLIGDHSTDDSEANLSQSIRNRRRTGSTSVENEDDTIPQTGPGAGVSALTESLTLLTHPTMIFLSFTFVYTGIELSFFSGVYSTCVGFTNKFPDAKRLVGLCGILVGIGEVVGGAIFGLLGSKMTKRGRDPIVLLGFLSHTVAFYLIFINIPNQAPLHSTDSVSYLENPSVTVAMLCAFLLGFGDACFCTQIYSILGVLFSDNSAPAFAIYKFAQSAAAAASFYYSSLFTLRTQLLILQISCIWGTLAFFIAEWSARRRANLRPTPPPSSSSTVPEEN